MRIKNEIKAKPVFISCAESYTSSKWKTNCSIFVLYRCFWKEREQFIFLLPFKHVIETEKVRQQKNMDTDHEKYKEYLCTDISNYKLI